MKNNYCSLLAFAFLFGHSSLIAQIITTVAGNGTIGFGGDNGFATAAELHFPRGISIDRFGNLIIADYGNNNIRKVTATGIISTIAGNGMSGYAGDGGAATAAQLNISQGVFADFNGNIFIADTWNHVVRKISTIGIISTIAGTGLQGYSGDGGQATAAKLGYPTALVVDASGTIFIAEEINHVVRKISPSGIITTVAGNGFGAGTTTGGYSGDGASATDAKLSAPRSVAVDVAGNLYIAVWGNHVIRKVNTAGIITTIAGNAIAGYSGDGGGATTAKLYRPSGVFVDGYGNVFIADSYNNVIRKVNSWGIITTVAGTGFGAGTASGGYTGDGGAATAAQLFAPVAVVVDSTGNLYFADWGNHVIRRVSAINTGTEQLSAANNNLLLRPNPNNGTFHITGSFGTIHGAPVLLTKTDVTGHTVYNETIVTQNGTFNKQVALNPALPKGIYLLHLCAAAESKVFHIVLE